MDQEELYGIDLCAGVFIGKYLANVYLTKRESKNGRSDIFYLHVPPYRPHHHYG
jgi:hypothetical protein